ncbi:MAG: PKD domain-containing protein, partial [Flavobacteriales bacterium]|nr:PKD domain-containing protein [Flavobacteriales bacterium]
KHKKVSEYYNYFKGHKSNWASGVPAYLEVQYQSLYKGVDLKIHSSQGNFKYDFIVEPFANVDQITLKYNGLDRLSINDKGQLALTTSIGNFFEQKPYAYQVINGQRVEIACLYSLNDGKVQFQFPNGYDKSLELIIDPTLEGATLSGSGTNGENYGHTSTFDNQGNIYTGARSFDVGYPTTPGAFQVTFNGLWVDMAISKLSPDATTLIYATYLGGSDADAPHSMFVRNGELHVLGSTGSTDYPVTASAYQSSLGGGFSSISDIVITHFNSTGTSLIGSSFIGGSDEDGANQIWANYGDDGRGEILVDASGDIFVACFTKSSDFPVTAGAPQSTLGGSQDAVFFKMNSNLSSLLWSTYFGGTMDDAGLGIRFDGAGNVYVTGTVGDGFYTANGYQTSFQGGSHDAFILKIDPSGSNILNSTYFGANDMEQSFFIDLDIKGDVYIFGQTVGANVPTTAGVYTHPNSKQFVSKFDPTLSTLLVSTLIGGTGGTTWPGSVPGLMSPTAFMVDQCGYIYFSGFNTDQSLPTSPGAFQTTGSFYLAVLEPDATALNFATYYGGIDDHVDGGTSRFDPQGIVYQSVCTDNGFNTTPGAYSSSYPGGFSYDIGVFKIDFNVQTLLADFTISPSAVGCAPLTVNFTNNSTGTDYIWDFGDGSPLDFTFQPTHTYTTPGVFDVMLIAIDSSSCIIRDTLYEQVVVGSPTPANAGFTDSVDCVNQQVFLNNTSTVGLFYQWDMGDGTTFTDSINFIHNYTPGTYTIELIVSDTVCNSADTVSKNVTIQSAVLADFNAAPSTSGCVPHTVNFINTSTNGISYEWDFGDGSPINTTNSPAHTYTSAGLFDATLIATNNGTCNIKDTLSIQILVNPGTPVTALFDDSVVCLNQAVHITNNSTANMLYEWYMGDGTTFNDSIIFEYPYASTGSYNVTLIVVDTVCGFSDTLTKLIDIPGNIIAGLTATPTQGCVPLAVNFQDTSTGTGPLSQNIWLFGDGSVPVVNNLNPIHTFTITGQFTTSLIVIDSSTCNIADTATVVITVGTSTPVVAAFDLIQDPDCKKLRLVGENNSTGDSINVIYEWDMGDGTIYTDSTDVTYQYFGAGTYTITLIAEDTVCQYSDTVSQTVVIQPGINFNAIAPPTLCQDDSALVKTDANTLAYDFVWSTGDSVPTIVVKNEGTYWVKVYDSICEAYDTIFVDYAPDYELGETVEQCYLGQGISLDIPVENASYRWNHGATDKRIFTSEPGEYGFAVTDQYGCYHEGLYVIIEARSSNAIYVPNAFTPDGDLLNEKFKPVAIGLDIYEFTIFNRWGDQVFYTEDINDGWDGIMETGAEPQLGVYVYRMRFSNECTQKAAVTTWGHFTLLR